VSLWCSTYANLTQPVEYGYLFSHRQQAGIIVRLQIGEILVAQIDEVGEYTDPYGAGWSTKFLKE